MQLKYSSSQKLFSSEQIKSLEHEYCFASGQSLSDLMQSAGTQVAAYINHEYAVIKELDRKILVFCGPGNNGGDGFVTAQILKDAGYNVELLLVSGSKYSELLQTQIERAKESGLNFKFIDHNRSDQNHISLSDLDNYFQDTGLIIDCLLGTGQKGTPRDLLGNCVEKILACKRLYPEVKIISVDVPTGIDCDTGQLSELFIVPDETLIMQHFKLGMVQSPALENLGRPVLLDIGLEDFELSSAKAEFELITSAELIARPRDCHKYDFGHVLVVAGSKSMPGAGLLSAAACIRSGAGLVSMVSTDSTFAATYPEIIYHRLDSDLNKASQDIISNISKYKCLLIGPGLGQGQDQTGFIYQLLREISARKIPAVLDADALNALSELHKMSVPLDLSSVVITPHAGEAARLLQVSPQEIQSNRYLSAKNLAKLFNSTVVLKGPSSICYSPESATEMNAKVNTSGGAYLATAGSGDVLSGMLAALIAQGQGVLRASSNAVFLHGLAAEIANAEHNGPIIASDIISKIPHALGKYQN